MGRRSTAQIAARVHGTYHVVEPDGPATAAVVGFHGYGETAEDHLEALQRIPGSERWLLCAVQALHPFYRKNGDVVAGWMTSFDRDHAIADNVAYAGAVVARLRERHGFERLAFTGFSQGVAMAYRTAAGAGHRSHALVALAGDVPPDVATGGIGNLPPVLIGRGSEEQWYTDAKLRSDLAVLRENGVPVETAPFDGGHEWSDAFAERAGAFLAATLDGTPRQR
jgi:predicted esterase